MTKKKVVSFFEEKNKNRVRPPVAAPGDTNSSDAAVNWVGVNSLLYWLRDVRKW